MFLYVSINQIVLRNSNKVSFCSLERVCHLLNKSFCLDVNSIASFSIAKNCDIVIPSPLHIFYSDVIGCSIFFLYQDEIVGWARLDFSDSIYLARFLDSLNLVIFSKMSIILIFSFIVFIIVNYTTILYYILIIIIV